jgi:hypothetical protein
MEQETIMFDEKLSAISICLFDPTGAANRRNVPASVWDWRDGRKHRTRRPNRLKAVNKEISTIENTELREDVPA